MKINVRPEQVQNFKWIESNHEGPCIKRKHEFVVDNTE